MSKYTVKVTAEFHYDTEIQDWITTPEDAVQDVIDFVNDPAGFFDFEVTE